MPQKLVILSGPSGAGKSTITKYLLTKEKLNLAFSISACSRKMRNDEVNGKDYYFLSIDTFKTKIEENEFLEWEEVYPNFYYGTLKVEVERLRSMGKSVVFDVDVTGAINIKRHFKEEAISIFVNPPSLEALEERLRCRNTETPENITKRMRKAKLELTYSGKFDYIITNNNLEETLAEVETLVDNFLKY